MDITKTTINGKVYQVANGTYYSQTTPYLVITHLENARAGGYRVRLFYGDNGRCWNDEYDTIGTVSRSAGTIKAPLLLTSTRSMGGGVILEHRIVRIDIREKSGLKVSVYLASGVSFDHFSFGPSDMPEYHTNVTNDTTGEIYARCKTYRAGVALAGFMNGKRWSK